MTDKPDTPRPVRVSKAPPPITPVSGRSSYRPPTKPPTSLIDWNHWRLTGLGPWQAAALTLNVNPDDMHQQPQVWMSGSVAFTADSFPSLEVKAQFIKRLSQIDANLHNKAHFKNRVVSLADLAAWCVHARYDNPPPALMAFLPPTTTEPAQTAATPAPVVAVVVASASGGVEPDMAGPAKPLQRTAAQDSAILCEIEKQGFDPLALPKNLPGKPGVKASIRAALSENSLFTGGTVFDKAWERLTARGDIAIQG